MLIGPNVRRAMAPRRKTALLSLYPLKQAVAGVIAPVEGQSRVYVSTGPRALPVGPPHTKQSKRKRSVSLSPAR